MGFIWFIGPWKRKKKKVNKTTVPFFSQPLPAYRKRLRWGLCQRSNKHKASFSRVNISSACLSEHQGEAQFILSRRRAKNPHRSFIHPQKKENEIKKDRNRPYIPAYTNMLRFLKDVGDGRVNKLSNASWTNLKMERGKKRKAAMCLRWCWVGSRPHWKERAERGTGVCTDTCSRLWTVGCNSWLTQHSLGWQRKRKYWT